MDRAQEQERLAYVRQLAEDMTSEHLDSSWTFRFSKSLKIAGACSPEPHLKVIALARWNALLSEEFIIRDTMLHEIAHALDPYVKGGAHHGENWQRIADELGVDPDLTWDFTLTRPWRGECDSGHPNFRHSRPRLKPNWFYYCCACNEFVREWKGPFKPEEVWWGTNAEVLDRHRKIWRDYFEVLEGCELAA